MDDSQTKDDAAPEAGGLKESSKMPLPSSAMFPPNVDLGLAEGTPRSGKESPVEDYVHIFQNLPECALVLDLEGVIRSANRQFLLVTGYSEPEVMHHSLAEFISPPEGMAPTGRAVERFILKTIMEGQVVNDYEMELKTNRDEVAPVSFSSSSVKNAEGHVVGVVLIGRDMSETRQLIQKLEASKTLVEEYSRSLEEKINERILEVKQRTRMLEELSITDELTKLYNRRFLFKRLSEEIHRSNRYGTPFSVVILDIDFFKKINDTYGHQAGDMVLYELSGIIQGSVRQMDVVARTGGEEFIIVLPSIKESHAFLFCERLREKVAGFQFTFLPEGVRVTISIGVADYPRETVHNLDELVRIADQALYKAKETRNTTTSSREMVEGK